MKDTARRHIRLAAVVAALTQLHGLAVAQCSLSSLPGGDVPGPMDLIYAMAEWDPDGAGPATPVLLIGGRITFVHEQPANGLCICDPATGTYAQAPLPPLPGSALVRAILVEPNGEIVLGGFFGPQTNVVRWTGGAWVPYPALTDRAPRSLTKLPNGDLVVVGDGGNVSHWNGSAWSQIGDAAVSGRVYSAVTVPNGDLLMVGPFELLLGSTTVPGVARWDGSAWLAVGAGLPVDRATDMGPRTIARAANGDLYVGSTLAPYLFRFDGTSWNPMPTPLNGPIEALHFQADGSLLAGGQNAPYIARWDGSNWSLAGPGREAPVNCIATTASGALFAGGIPRYWGSGVSRWDGSSWTYLGVGTNGPVNDSIVMPNGDLVVGGDFTRIGDIAAANVARWDGAHWSPLGNGLPARVTRLQRAGADIIAAGPFASGGLLGVARWDGATWQPMGAGISGTVQALEVMPNGDVVAGGSIAVTGQPPLNGLARWDGISWSPFSPALSGLISVAVNALAVDSVGRLIVGGAMVVPGETRVVVRMDAAGPTTLAIGPLHGEVASLLQTRSGRLIAGLPLLQGVLQTPAVTMSEYNGAFWLPLGQSLARASIRDIEELPAGGLGIGGTMGSGLLRVLMRYDGVAWTDIGTPRNFEDVATLRMTPEGELFVGGTFLSLDRWSPGFARMRSSCPAAATPEGAGCSGSAGPVTLVADSLPWIGGSYSTTATGFGQNALAVWIVGSQPLSVPLSAVHPAALPGCLQLSSFDVAFGYTMAVNGRSQVTTAIPNNPAIVGLTFRKQVASVELDTNLDIVQIASSNALAVTVGRF